MSLSKEILDACNKMRDSALDLDKVINVPRETPGEINKLKNEINNTQMLLAMCFVLLILSLIMHGIRSHLNDLDDIKRVSIDENRLKIDIQENQNRMINSYNSQMVKILENELKSLKEDLSYEANSARTNKILYRACMADK